MKLKMSPPNILIPQIDAYLESLNKNREGQTIAIKKEIHPSSIGECSRAIVYQILGIGAVEKIDSGLRRIFDNGTFSHHRIQEYLVKAGLVDKLPNGKDAIEVPMWNQEYWIRGTCDGILILEGKKFVLEIKTINTWAYAKLLEVQPHYLDQLTLYLYCMAIPQGIFLFENKDTQAMREFVVELDEQRLDKLQNKIRFVQKCVNENTIPAKECDTKSKGKYCRFCEYCWKKDA